MAREKITIKLHMSEIIYDIQNKTYITSRSRETGDNYELIANMQANDDEDNIAQLMRSITNALSIVKAKLGDYTLETKNSANNELLDSSTDIVISLEVPSNYNKSSTEVISSSIHNFIVYMSIAEWFNITDKNDSAEYVTMANTAMETIREAINKRVRPVKKPLVPETEPETKA